MKTILLSILLIILFIFVGVPLMIMWVMCDEFTWENIKKVYRILFWREDK